MLISSRGGLELPTIHYQTTMSGLLGGVTDTVGKTAGGVTNTAGNAGNALAACLGTTTSSPC
jgi:hypothetical protein